MADELKYVLGDDLPKKDPWKEDQLNYAPFAERIAKVIIGLYAPNGYVIGLHGTWGSGKSTILNFILEFLQKHNADHQDDEVIHIDFRPWIVSGHQDLIAAFFTILYEKLGSKDTKRRRLFKRFVRLINGTTDNLVDAAARVAMTVDPSSGAASGFAGKFAKKSVNSLIAHFMENPSLQKAYEDLNEQLRHSKKRFLVTIDDIDRLKHVDIKSIMEMVKSIGGLPNIVYVLSYDREIVWKVLDQDVNRAGPCFAEKIIQQEIELPTPSRSALSGILDQEISFLVSETKASSRWQYIVRDGVHRWIQSPRDVVRLSNAVKFSWPALQGELDPHDLLAIEGLRLFDSAAFTWVRDNRDFLFTSHHVMAIDDELKQIAVDDLKQRIPHEWQSQVLGVISVLFPVLRELVENRQAFSGEHFMAVAKRRGIGCEAGYDAYFGLHTSSDAIPMAVVNKLMSMTEDTDAIEAIFHGYLGKKNSQGEQMVVKLLGELRAQYHGRDPAKPTQALLDVLFRVGEELVGTGLDTDIFTFSAHIEVDFLVHNILQKWGPAEAGKRLIEAFKKATSPAFLADIYVARGRELGIFKADSSDPSPITTEDFDNLGDILIGKIEKASEDGTLSAAPFFFHIITSWGHLSTPDAAKAWLNEGITNSSEFMVKACIGLVSHSIGTVERNYTMRDHPDPEFYDLGVLLAAGKKHLEGASLTIDQRNR